MEIINDTITKSDELSEYEYRTIEFNLEYKLEEWITILNSIIGCYFYYLVR